jgi:decaprenylphospho-beta-D-erythro-pentofuranosid-2-ulose 2-reductase
MRDGVGAVQRVLVLGGGSDIAQATVRALVAQGAGTVVLAARHPEQLKAFADELRPAQVECLPFDGRDLESHVPLIRDVWSRHGDIDVALVAFGVLGDHDVSARDPAVAAEVLQTNLVGAASVSLAAVNEMQVQGHGTLVVLSSVAAERVRKSMFVYAASKAGLDGFCQGLADSLAGSGVDVLVVRPGFVHTKMTAGQKAAPFSTSPEAVADAIVAGIRNRTGTIWVPPLLRGLGVVMRHVPRALWRRVER